MQVTEKIGFEIDIRLLHPYAISKNRQAAISLLEVALHQQFYDRLISDIVYANIGSPSYFLHLPSDIATIVALIPLRKLPQSLS